MIISKIIGGLGNQLFQYAAGKTLALLNKTELKLDVTAFDEYKLRSFDLLNFNLEASFASNDEINRLLPNHNFEKAFQYLKPINKRTYYREKEFHFNKEVLQLGADVYLKGYFQSEKYFLPVKETISKELNFKKDAIKNVEAFSAALTTAGTVAVHIRRGDLSHNQVSTDYHGILSTDYYQKAVEIIRSEISNPEFYFFSDDIQWVKENLAVKDAIYVSGEITNNHIEDLYLMSQCHHNIIANSSFSWWGAWLNNNPDKIVIAPKNWFNKGPKDTDDLYPDRWLVI